MGFSTMWLAVRLIVFTFLSYGFLFAAGFLFVMGKPGFGHWSEGPIMLLLGGAVLYFVMRSDRKDHPGYPHHLVLVTMTGYISFWPILWIVHEWFTFEPDQDWWLLLLPVFLAGGYFVCNRLVWWRRILIVST